MSTKKLSSTKVQIQQKYNRSFSESFKRKKVKEILEKRLSIKQVSELYGVSRTSVYKWIYKYSALERGTKQVIQMESEALKTKLLLQQVAELERVVGQKQLEIDYLSKTLELASKEVGYDLKKKVRPEVIEWFRKHRKGLHYQMKDVFLVCGISKQAHAQALKRAKVLRKKEALYIGFMYEIRDMHPGMGLRKMYEQFQPEGIGRDAFIVLGLREGLRLRSISNPTRTTWSVKSARYPNLLAGRRFTAVNQIWASDIFYFQIGSRHYYVVLIMDVYSRRIIGYSAADNLRAENNIDALRMALNLRGVGDYQKQLIHHSDRGSQYISDDYTNLLEDFNIQISMCTDVLENAHMERANGTIKNDYLARWNIKQAYTLARYLKKAVDNYNHRAHDSLGKKTPIEFETYVKELSEEEKPPLEIFTINKQISENPNQFRLFPSL
jgi:putative transposase